MKFDRCPDSGECDLTSIGGRPSCAGSRAVSGDWRSGSGSRRGSRLGCVSHAKLDCEEPAQTGRFQGAGLNRPGNPGGTEVYLAAIRRRPGVPHPGSNRRGTGRRGPAGRLLGQRARQRVDHRRRDVGRRPGAVDCEVRGRRDQLIPARRTSPAMSAETVVGSGAEIMSIPSHVNPGSL